ncbi:MAG TPA: hypothetical protein DCZ91_17945 [Lachnospiraceae bacterium]|nr:hypothetical protein [Lachnospiraceae bacterium]
MQLTAPVMQLTVQVLERFFADWYDNPKEMSVRIPLKEAVIRNCFCVRGKSAKANSGKTHARDRRNLPMCLWRAYMAGGLKATIMIVALC